MPGPRTGKKRKHEGDSNDDSGSISTSSQGSNTTKSPSVRPRTNPPKKDLAKSLLGQRLVHTLSDGQRLSGIIVETEAYLGFEDSACHTYKGHRSERVETMYGSPGTCYVYLIYGMYHCLNISSKGEGQAVLIRALESQEGIPTMRKLRDIRRKNPTKELKTKDLCNGPGKLTAALQITKAEMNGAHLASSPALWVESGVGHHQVVEEGDIVVCPRIGVDYATPEYVKKPLRFYIRGGECVSKRDKEAEISAGHT